jgi:hypothetical protein
MGQADEQHRAKCTSGGITPAGVVAVAAALIHKAEQSAPFQLPRDGWLLRRVPRNEQLGRAAGEEQKQLEQHLQTGISHASLPSDVLSCLAGSLTLKYTKTFVEKKGE